MDKFPGEVELVSTEVTNCRGLKLLIIGESSCERRKCACASRHKQNRCNYRRKGCRDHEIFLRHERFLLGSALGLTIELLPGVKSVEFSFELPSNVPASFDNNRAKVFYSIEAIVIPVTTEVQGFSKKLPLTVLSSEETNKSSLQIEPISYKVSKSFHKVFGKTEPLSVIVSLPSNRFVS